MKTTKNNLEILSPAGNLETFYSAINAGADAIYLGLSSFNARMKAENFTTKNIREIVRYAHTFGVKIYVTLNTLITDDDIDEVVSLVKVLIESRVDAFIVQDFGIVNLLKTCFPNITLHASTQMGIHNLEGAKVAEKLGITRIVLSRETKLEDIKLIHQNTNLEIEYFIQGALCVAFSGNCYLSSLEKGMSGNEGKCLQLCRLPYKNTLTNEVAYNLSARDLSLLENLKDIIDAGVISFKIEGRMRHAGYCAVVTKIYKDTLKLIETNELTKTWIEEKQTLLRETFSRGEFNKSAYLEKGTPDSIINKDYQNHIGIKIGTVLSVKPFKNDLFIVQVQTNSPLHSGDGIKIINEKTKEQVASLGLGNINQKGNSVFEFITKYKFDKNLSVFLTQNSELENNYLSLKRKVKFNLKVEAFANKNLKILCSTDNLNFDYCSDFELQSAKNAPLSHDDFYNQLSKLEDTAFELENLEVVTDGIFMPKSLLNEVRRTIVSMLQEKLIESNESKIATFDENKFNELSKTQTKINPKNIAIIDENFNFDKDFDKLNNFEIVVLSPKYYTKKTILAIFDILKDKFALNLPTILNASDKKIIDEILESLPQNIYLFANNIYGLNYADKYNVITSPLLNTKNKLSLLLLNELGVNIICASVEASDEFVESQNLIKFTGGKFPLMTFAHCPIKTIYGGSCQTCNYKHDFELQNSNLGSYKVDRFKLNSCYFELSGDFLYKKLKFSLYNLCK